MSLVLARIQWPERIVAGDVHDIQAARAGCGMGGRSKSDQAEGGKGECLHGNLPYGQGSVPKP